ncbi:MAG: hypothetical protein U5R46_01200 [Gammaproteobacteria bacterium]|nr:hypothetical protein [Gammaproteobacteria bacterium]
MSDKKQSETGAREQRRRSVKTILGAGGLVAGAQLGAGEWIKPVVNTVTLPAHAATSAIRFDDSLEDPCFISVVCTGSRGELEITVTGFVLPPTPDIAIDLDIQVELFGGSFEDSEYFASTTTDGNGEYSVTESRSQNGITAIRITATLPDFPEAGEAICTLDFDADNSDHYGSSYFCDDAPLPA